MKFLFALLISMVVAVTGCAKAPTLYTVNPRATDFMPEVTPVWIDTKFTPDQKQAIVEALDAWTYALNGYNRFELVSQDFDMDISVLEQVMHTGQGLLVLDRSVTDPVYDDLPNGVLAWVEDGVPIVNIFGDVVGNRNVKAIAMHEMGHYLGITGRYAHTAVKGTLMFPSYTYSQTCIDRLTMQTLATFRPKYDWHHTNYCNKPE